MYSISFDENEHILSLPGDENCKRKAMQRQTLHTEW